MSFRKTTLRTVRTMLPVLAGGILLSGTAIAQAQNVTMATWGGGVGEAWRTAFAAPYQNHSGESVKINEVPNPEAQVRAQANAPQYNAVLVSYFEAAKLYQDGLIDTISEAEVPEVLHTPDKYKMKGDNGELIGVPAYFTYYGIAFNTDYVKPEEMQSWEDLAAPKWKGQIAVTQPIYSSTYHLTILSHALGGDEKNVDNAIPLFKKHVNNAAVVYTSLAQLNQLLTRGEVVAAPYYLARIWAMKKSGVKNIDISLPKEGGLLLPYMVVIPKGAQNREDAIKWLNFIASATPQEITAERFGYFPLNETAKITSEQEELLGMTLEGMKSKLFQPDWFVIANAQNERIKTVEQIISQAD